jgi:rare lipoprotein A
MRLPRLRRDLACLALTLGLAGCAGHGGDVRPGHAVLPRGDTSATNPRAPKIGNPYQVFGVWYYPADDKGYDERGIASWYGPGFHALNTANGETYDQQAISAAHKTLPLPSYVEVENLDNGRRLTVRINDRGPFVDGRIIDLSQRSAQLLGVDRPGTARVRVHRVLPDAATIASLEPARSQTAPAPVIVAAAVVAPRSMPAPVLARPLTPASAVAPPVVAVVALPPSSAPTTIALAPTASGGGSFVQVAALGDPGRISWLSGYLGEFGPVVTERIASGLTRIRLGPYESVDSANAVLARVQAAGYTGARLIQPKALR